MRRLRIGFAKLSFNVKYALAYVWTAISVVAIFLGAKTDINYFWIIPAMCSIALWLFKDKISRFLSIILAIDIALVILTIATKNISMGNIITMEIIIVVLGPLFFKEHAS